jgi:hypothetical protein
MTAPICNSVSFGLLPTGGYSRAIFSERSRPEALRANRRKWSAARETTYDEQNPTVNDSTNGLGQVRRLFRLRCWFL